MQDIKRIIENKEEYKEVVSKKKIDLDVDALITLYETRQALQKEVEDLRRERNENVDEIKKIQGKPPEVLIQKGKEIKEKLQEKENEFSKVDDEYKKIMWKTPQFISSDTPVGKDDSDNVELRRWSAETGDGGDPKTFNFEFKDHVELGTSLNILDLERGVKTGGFRGYYLKNEGALMHMGLMMYGLKLIQSKGFQIFVPPTIVKSDALWGSGHFPFDEENVYVVDSMKNMEDEERRTKNEEQDKTFDNTQDKTFNAQDKPFDNTQDKEKKYLVGTAEPSLLNYYRDEVLDEKDLPKKLAGFSQCYRSEIGSHGKDTKGIYRIHEFMKIEQVVLCKNYYEVSEKLHTEMLSYSEELLRNLKLPYRVLQICTGDMGAGKYKMYDIETWMPSRGAYGETHSASNLGDWQTRRLNLKAINKDANKYYPHALNNTVVASPRILIAIWENYQNADGTITVPEVLREYVGKDVIGK